MTAVVTPIFKMLVDYLAELAGPEEILAFQFPKAQDERLQDLLEANAIGELTDEERAELEQMIYFNEVLTLMKARAQASLKNLR